MLQKQTLAIHGKQDKSHKALRFPLYQNVSFSFDKAQDMADTFQGKLPLHAYSRITNPTIDEFENKLTTISQAQASLAVSSGMAAISLVLLALGKPGANLVASPFLFGNTYSLLTQLLPKWGLEVRFANMMDIQDIKSKIDDNSIGVFFEIISNPQLEVANCKAISKLAQEYNLPVIVDTTAVSPLYANANELGINIQVISTTKYISGGATSVGGAVIDQGNFDWSNTSELQKEYAETGKKAFIAHIKKNYYRHLGCCMSPFTAYMQSLGIETLQLRIKKSCDNTMELATFLQEHPLCHSVSYPGLTSSLHHKQATTQFGNVYGSMLTFSLKNQEACFAFLDKLQLIALATNLQDNKTMILHLASTIYCDLNEQERKLVGITTTMIRLCVGIEDIEDLKNDLQQALNSLT